MKVITEAIVRDELRNSEIETYYIPEGKILSPAAREYLQMKKIKAFKESERGEEKPAREAAVPAAAAAGAPRFTDYVTGAMYLEKPEHMTHLHGNTLVPKSHPRIIFRGKLDALQAEVVLSEAIMAESGVKETLLNDLEDVLKALRGMMRADVLDEEFCGGSIIGLSHVELRERSHDPQRFYGVKAMTLPDYRMGKTYALLNRLRTMVRECEASAAAAFKADGRCSRTDIIEELNRLSSALHIMMCKQLSGGYK